MLTAWKNFSQEGTKDSTTVELPFRIAQLVAIDLVKYDALKIQSSLDQALIYNYEKQIWKYQQNDLLQDFQLSLMKKNYDIRTDMNETSFFGSLWKGLKNLLLYLAIFSIGVGVGTLN